jgi:hypothetical protein
MNIEERLDRMEDGIRGLIVVSRTVLTSVQELRSIQLDTIASQRELAQEMRESHKHTDEKINILIDTVDRIIRPKDDPGTL